MGLLDGKRILVTGVLTDASIAFHVARLAQEQGAEVVLTSFGRLIAGRRGIAGGCPSRRRSSSSTSPTPRTSPRSPTGSASTSTASTASCTRSASRRRPRSAATSSTTAWEDVATALQVSAYSLKSLAVACAAADGRRAARSSGSTFDATVAWPVYDWMGVAKAAFESTPRYLARDLGPERHPGQPRRGRPDPDHGRQVHPRLREFEDVWADRAPLGWDITDPEPPPRRPASRCCRTGSRRPPARSCTSTAASTRSA